MRPFVINGEAWRVARVPAGDPRLVDRTGQEKLATTDPRKHEVYINDSIVPPLLDKVMLHEVAHAITLSWDLLGYVHNRTPKHSWIDIEEWNAQVMENHAIEAINAASVALGRPICVRGFCASAL